MCRRLLLVLFLAAIMVVCGNVNRSAEAVEDPVDAIKNSKTPVHFHSLAPGNTLITNWADVNNSQWHSLYPPTTYCHNWTCIGGIDNGDGLLSPKDRLKMQHDVTNNWLWTYVDDVTITLILTLEPDHLDTMYIEYTAGYDSLMWPIGNPVSTWWHEIRPNWCQIWHIGSWIDNGDGELSICDTIDMAKAEDISWWHVLRVVQELDSLWFTVENPEDPADSMFMKYTGSGFPDSVAWAIQNPICTWWHELRPNFCQIWHIGSWKDNLSEELDSCDIIDMAKLEDISWWHVEDVAIDIMLFSTADPTVPTLTQWGVIVLVALLISSAVYITLRKRRKATMVA